ncbi:MAG: AraC family ligand binding domain-containing protein [Gemmataceae bacterium]
MCRRESNTSSDISYMWHVELAHGLDLMRAAHGAHTFPRHFHETFVVQAIEAGADEFYCDGRNYRAEAGSLVLINPGEVHTGQPAVGRTLRYCSLYLQARYVAEVAAELGWRGSGFPEFPRCVVRAPRLANRVLQLGAALEQPDSLMQAESSLFEGVTEIFSVGGFRPRVAAPLSETPRVKAACEYLEANLSGQPTLDELAAIAGVTRFHFLRLFRRTTGLPPHQYLLNLRVEEARRQLRQGVPPAQVAVALGFTDQSHLNRYFKRQIGLTPGRYPSPPDDAAKIAET